MDKKIKIEIYKIYDFIWLMIAIIGVAVLCWSLMNNLPYGYIWVPIIWCLFSAYLLINFINSSKIIINHEGKYVKVSGKTIKISDIISVEKRKIIEHLNFPSFSRERICFVLKDAKNIYFPGRFMPSIADKNDLIIAQLKKELWC